jgi:hypothetical protein
MLAASLSMSAVIKGRGWALARSSPNSIRWVCIALAFQWSAKNDDGRTGYAFDLLQGAATEVGVPCHCRLLHTLANAARAKVAREQVGVSLKIQAGCRNIVI